MLEEIGLGERGRVSEASEDHASSLDPLRLPTRIRISRSTAALPNGWRLRCGAELRWSRMKT
jgi:hypothetical protein